MKNTLKIQRKKKNVSQQKLAEAVKISRQSIYLIEKGEITPKLGTAFKIANFFKLSIEEVFNTENTEQ